jgi:streptomycin 6-kinase
MSFPEQELAASSLWALVIPTDATFSGVPLLDVVSVDRTNLSGDLRDLVGHSLDVIDLPQGLLGVNRFGAALGLGENLVASSLAGQRVRGQAVVIGSTCDSVPAVLLDYLAAVGCVIRGRHRLEETDG